MAFQGPWGARTTTTAIDTTGVSLGLMAGSPGAKVPAVEVVLENIGANILDVSFDGGVTYAFQIPVGGTRTLKGSMGNEVFVKAAAVTTGVQWAAHGGSP